MELSIARIRQSAHVTEWGTSPCLLSGKPTCVEAGARRNVVGEVQVRQVARRKQLHLLDVVLLPALQRTR